MKMSLNGVEKVMADKATVAAFVADPNQVGKCMPDLQRLDVLDQNRFVAMVRIGIGPIRGTFKMEVEMEPDPAGDALAMKLKGSGMGNGLAMNSALKISPGAAGGTELHWTADASVSGPLAGIGGRLLEGQAKKTTETLFANIRQALEAR